MAGVLPVAGRNLRDSWRGLLAWALGLTAALALYLPLFPSFGSNGSLEEIIATLPPELVDALGYDQIGTGSGYAQATFFGLIGFGKGRDAFIVCLRAAHHALPPPIVDHGL